MRCRFMMERTDLTFWKWSMRKARVSLLGCGISEIAWKSSDIPSVTSGLVAAWVNTAHWLWGITGSRSDLRKSFTTPVSACTSLWERLGQPRPARNFSRKSLTSFSLPGIL